MQNEVIEYITAALANIKALKVPDKAYTLNGIKQEPQTLNKTVKEVLMELILNVDSKVLHKIYPAIYTELKTEVIKDPKVDNFYVLDIENIDIKHNGKTWDALYKMKVTDAKTNKVALQTEIVLDTTIVHKSPKYKDSMLKLLNERTDGFVSKSRVQKVEKTSLSFKPFLRLTNELDTLKASPEQTKHVFERVAAVFKNYDDEKLVKDVKQSEGLLLVEAFSKRYNEHMKIIIGGDGFYLEGYAYTRKGTEKEGDRDYATKFLHNQLGFNVLWTDLVNCYDFRKNVQKEGDV